MVRAGLDHAAAAAIVTEAFREGKIEGHWQRTLEETTNPDLR